MVRSVGLDAHAYRKPLADDCVCGSCSMNNCRYPDCSVEALKSMGRVIDDVLPTVPVLMFKGPGQ